MAGQMRGAGLGLIGVDIPACLVVTRSAGLSDAVAIPLLAGIEAGTMAAIAEEAQRGKEGVEIG